MQKLLEVFLVFFRLGLTAFGGPVAHLAYFRDEFVKRRAWLTDRTYADVVTLCQFLPGPASSQVGMAVGYLRAGYIGSILAWLAFTLPSAAILTAFAYWFTQNQTLTSLGFVTGLKVVAAAVVLQAVIHMGKTLCPDKETLTLAVLACTLCSLFKGSTTQVLTIILGALAGRFLLKPRLMALPPYPPNPHTRGATICLLLFFLLLAAPYLGPAKQLEQFRTWYQAGSMVFGGGHVVLPLLESEFVQSGRISRDEFLAGYGAAQAVPGPLFTFASYLGAVQGKGSPLDAAQGALYATVCIFLPAYLLVLGVLPFWHKLLAISWMRSAASGANAAVVGVLLAAFYDPILTSAVHNPKDFACLILTLLLLQSYKVSPWILVLGASAVYQWLI